MLVVNRIVSLYDSFMGIQRSMKNAMVEVAGLGRESNRGSLALATTRYVVEGKITELTQGPSSARKCRLQSYAETAEMTLSKARVKTEWY